MKTYTVYRIRNIFDGNCYVGLSATPEKRIAYHFSNLKSDSHTNHEFQRAYNIYGRNAFEIEILETDIPSDTADSREKAWIAYYNSHFDGYNRSNGGNYSRWGRRKTIS